MFPVQEIEQLVEDYKCAVPLILVPEYLDGSQSMVQALYSAGQLRALIPADAPGAVRRVVFARRELDAILAKLRDLPVKLSGSGADLIQLADACQRFGVRAGDAMSAVLSGQMMAMRSAGAPSLHGVWVERAVILKFREEMRAMC